MQQHDDEPTGGPVLPCESDKPGLVIGEKVMLHNLTRITALNNIHVTTLRWDVDRYRVRPPSPFQTDAEEWEWRVFPQNLRRIISNNSTEQTHTVPTFPADVNIEDFLDRVHGTGTSVPIVAQPRHKRSLDSDSSCVHCGRFWHKGSITNGSFQTHKSKCKKKATENVAERVTATDNVNAVVPEQPLFIEALD